MKRETFEKAIQINSEIINLKEQIEHIKNPKCNPPLQLQYVQDMDFENEIKSFIIKKIEQRIKELEKEFDNLK